MDLSGGIGMMDVDDEQSLLADTAAGDGSEADADETREETAPGMGVDIRLLRQEEEESTQDVMAEMRALEERKSRIDAPAPVVPGPGLGADIPQVKPNAWHHICCGHF